MTCVHLAGPAKAPCPFGRLVARKLYGTFSTPQEKQHIRAVLPATPHHAPSCASPPNRTRSLPESRGHGVHNVSAQRLSPPRRTSRALTLSLTAPLTSSGTPKVIVRPRHSLRSRSMRLHRRPAAAASGAGPPATPLPPPTQPTHGVPLRSARPARRYDRLVGRASRCLASYK